MMAGEEPTLFSCGRCGRTHVWRAAMVGRRVRCPCGRMMEVPADEVASADQIRPDRMDPGSVRALQSGPLTAASTGQAVMPTGPRVHVPKQHRYASERRRYRGAVLLAVILIGGAVAYVHYFQPATPVQVLQGDDGEVTQLADKMGMHEAMAWLAEPRHDVRGMETSVAKSTVRDLLSAGAVRVFAFGDAISDRLAIELPDDPDARKRVFAWCASWQKGLRQEPIGDCKQHYLLLHTPDDTVRSLR